MRSVEEQRAAAMAREARHPGAPLLDRLEAGLYRVEALVAGASLAVMLITILVSVAARYFALPLPNYGEYALVAMSSLTFVGAAMCSYLGAHIAVDVVQLLPAPILRTLARGVAAGAQLAFAVLFAYVAWEFFAYAAQSGERLIDLGTPVAIPGAFMLSGGLLMAFHGTAELIRLVRGLPHPGRSR